MKAQGGRHRSLTPFMSRVNSPRNIPDNPTCPGADGQPVSGTLKKKWRTLDILQAGDSCRFLTTRHSPLASLPFAIRHQLPRTGSPPLPTGMTGAGGHRNPFHSLSPDRPSKENTRFYVKGQYRRHVHPLTYSPA